MTDEHAIRAVVAKWMDATRRGDVAAVLDLMTDDVVFMTPGREPFGKAEFARLSVAQDGVRIDGDSDVREVEVAGDWAFARSFLRVTATPLGGTPVRRAGWTMSIFRKERDGRWRIARDANLLTIQA